MANFIFLLLFLLQSWDDWGCLQMAWGNVSYTHVCRHSVFPVLAPVFLRAPVQGSSRSYISSAPQSSIIGGINFRACLRTSRYISTLQKKFNDLVGKYGAWRQAHCGYRRYFSSQGRCIAAVLLCTGGGMLSLVNIKSTHPPLPN